MAEEFKIVPKSWLASLGESIRGLLNITDKLSLDEILDKVDEVYASGYEKGLSEGGGSDDGVLASLIDRSIMEVNIPHGVTKIGDYAFCGCNNVVKFTIPDSVTVIGNQACNGIGTAKGVDEVIMPDSITTMGAHAFVWSGVKKFVISKNIDKIEASVFGGCSKCELYDFSRYEAVPSLVNVNAFDQMTNYKKAKILVPAALYDDWIVATNWSNFADYIEPYYIISEGLEYETDSWGNKYVIGRGSCTDSVIVIPDGVTQIAEGAFVNDQMIDTLVLPESGAAICDGSLDGSSLKKIVNCNGSVHSFALSGLSIERISFIDSWGISGLALMRIQGSPVYDFSKCTAIVPINGDVEYVSVGEDTQIIVPAALYDEWVADTNWAYFADYIVAAE